MVSYFPEAGNLNGRNAYTCSCVARPTCSGSGDLSQLSDCILFSTAKIITSHLKIGVKSGDVSVESLRVSVEKKDLRVGGRVKKATAAISVEHSELLHTHIQDWSQILVTYYFTLDWAIGLLRTILSLTKLCVSGELHTRRYLVMPFIKSKHLRE